MPSTSPSDVIDTSGRGADTADVNAMKPRPGAMVERCPSADPSVGILPCSARPRWLSGVRRSHQSRQSRRGRHRNHRDRSHRNRPVLGRRRTHPGVRQTHRAPQDDRRTHPELRRNRAPQGDRRSRQGHCQADRRTVPAGARPEPAGQESQVPVTRAVAAAPAESARGADPGPGIAPAAAATRSESGVAIRAGARAA